MNQNQINETLSILQEECAEVIQAISKVFRFGDDTHWPLSDSPTNKDHLATEVGQVLAMIDILVESSYLSDADINDARLYKKEKLKTWSTIYAS